MKIKNQQKVKDNKISVQARIKNNFSKFNNVKLTQL